MKNNIQKCAIIGCGFVGATTAYTLVQSELFSSMVLIDKNKKKAEGEAKDLNHALPFISPMEIYAGSYGDLSDASIVIICAGANQLPGQTRDDLLKCNVRVFEEIVSEITKYNKDCIIIVVTNPVDILTYVTLKKSGFPASHVIGSGTVLDTARLKYLLGRRLGVDYRNVHSFIIGEHGDSELPVWSSANVSGIDLNQFCQQQKNSCGTECLQSIFNDVKMSAYKIIEEKGATYYAIAEAVRKIVSAIVRDEMTILPVSTLITASDKIEGVGDIDDIVLSMPCIIGNGGIEEVLSIPLDKTEAKNLYETAVKLKGIASGLNF